MFNIAKSSLPYDVSRGGQSIELIDLSIFKNNTKNKLNHCIVSKTEELKKQYNEMIDLWEWNNYVETFSINFEPIKGNIYYLYEASTKFLSILSPTELKSYKYLGSTKLNSDGYWERLN
jgi:hypothetical protein